MIFTNTAAIERIKAYHKEAKIRQLSPSSRQTLASILKQIAKYLDNTKDANYQGGSYVQP